MTSETSQGTGVVPPVIEARVKKIITVDGLSFKDLNGNGQLDPYEDWRRPVAERVDDLVGRMSLEQKGRPDADRHAQRHLR